MDKKLFASDLDGTLISQEGIEYEKEVSELKKLLTQNFIVCYVTGRYFDFAKSGIEGSKLPKADYLICNVGTEIYFKDSQDKWKLLSSYENALASCLSPDRIVQLRKDLKQIQGVEIQEEIKQGKFKLSYYCKSSDIETISNQIAQIANTKNIEISVIKSIDVKTKSGLIDILPKGASKLKAISHLLEVLAMSRSNCVYAGDSGNDLEVFLSGIYSILVYNCPSYVKQKVQNKAGTNYYISDYKCMEGVVDGLKNYHEIHT